MKRMAMTMAAAAIGLSGVAAHGAVVANETFDTLTPGTLNGQGSGAGWSGNWVAASGQAVEAVTPLSYSFSGAGAVTTVNGGPQALAVTGSNDNLVRRSLSSSFTGDNLYFSFLLQRNAEVSGGAGTFDFAVWWLDNTSSGNHGNAPNIGVYDPTTGGNEVMARNGTTTQSTWAEAGGASSTSDTLFVVGRLKKGVSGGGSDYDGWDLWVFDTEAAPRSVLSFLTPDDTGANSNSKTSINQIGIRTAALEGGDKFTYDDIRLGTTLADVVPVTLADTTTAASINGAHTLTFSEAGVPGAGNKIVVSNGDAILTDHGISSLTAVAADGTDWQNQTGQSGEALFADAGEMFILSQNTGGNNNQAPLRFGETTSFTLDFARDHQAFGVSFQDQVGATFQLDFYKDGVLQGTVTESTGTTTDQQIVVRTLFDFDRVVISGGAAGDGWGIDNILLDAVDDSVGPEVMSGPYVKTVDFEDVPTGPTGMNTFTTAGLTITATGGGTGSDVASVGSDNGNGLFWDGSQFVVLPAGEGSYDFGENQVYTLDFHRAISEVGLVLTDQAVGDFLFTFLLDGVLQAEFVKGLPNINNQTFFFATDFLFDTLVVDGLDNGDGFGIDNVTFNIPEPASAALLGLAGAGLLARRRA